MQFSSICRYIFSWTILGQMSLMVVISHSSSPYGRACRWLWWSYICMTNLLIRPFFQTRGYGSGFIFQFLILAMALLGTGIVLLLAHNHLCLSPSTTGSGFSGYAPELVYLLTSSVSQSLVVILRSWFYIYLHSWFQVMDRTALIFMSFVDALGASPIIMWSMCKHASSSSAWWTPNPLCFRFRFLVRRRSLS